MARFAWQTELFGLTAAQRASGATAINNALDSQNVSDVTNRTVVADFAGHGGEIELYAQADFASQLSLDNVWSTALAWASARAVDAADGRHSYLRMVTIDAGQTTITTRLAESPGWVEGTTTRPFAQVKQQ